MAAASLLSLDHAGIVVRDLAAGAARWERLGFTLSPQSRQRGAVPGRQGMHPWGSANRCAIFERGYLELIGLVDASAWNPWQAFLDRFEGMRLLALRCANADAAYAELSPRAPFLDAPVQRERRLAVDGEERTMRFRNVFSRDVMCPEGRYIVIEHQTPELLWQSALMQHDNGAVALEEAMVVADDAGVAGRIATLGGIPAVSTPAGFRQRYGWAPQAPAFAGVTVSFSNLAVAAQMMETRGVKLRRAGGDLWVAAEDANGFVLRMVQC
jgi:hypothetical protein